VQELAPGVFVETGFRRVNVGAILTDEGFVLIDTPPYPNDAHYWREMLAAISDRPVLAIINTDCHRDRVIGNCWFDARVIVAHDDTIAQMRNLPTSFVDAALDTLTISPHERGIFSGAQLRIPSIGFTRRMQLRYGGRTIPLLAMPGPTSGSLWVHLPEQRLLFASDSVIVNQHPYISSPCTKDWLESLTMLRRARFPADLIVPGRGPLVDKDATEPLSNYLRLARRRVHSLFHAGRPRADTSTLVPELLDLFPYQEDDLENVQRRIKGGLDRIYEEFKSNDKANDLPGS
jgi:glyoxylase-like metal-dependent hydrolase (beta-lactamase superfamily II)